MRVLALDPGYGRLGVAVVDRNQTNNRAGVLVFSECITTEATTAFEERLSKIMHRIASLCDTYHPDHLALERLFFNTNQKTAMRVAEVRGALLHFATERHMPVFEYTPAQIKIAVTGYGKSGKKDVARMVDRLLNIQKHIALDDEYDAIAVGLTHTASVGIQSIKK